MTRDEYSGDAPFVVLQQDGAWRLFANPVRVIAAQRSQDVIPAIREIERGVEEEGLVAAGYLAYETAAAYGLDTHTPEPDGPPLLWFGLFRGREPIGPPSPGGAYHFGPWQPSLDYSDYAAAIDRIKETIAAGYTYQANFTFQLRAGFAGDPWALFSDLSRAQRANYCAYIDLGRHVICSASPELFFRREGETLEARPMKGTAPRGLTTADDRRQIEWLRGSEKNQAENVMIVDMIRNDFGRVARAGSVNVPALFTIERYPTLLQMTSTVTAQTGATLADVLAATFPCASITGAPKVRTMELLRQLERQPRGVYTGAIGAIAPGGRAQFSVAIRTAVIDRVEGQAVYGVGSGIVWDSDAAAEYDECLLKARVLAAPRHTLPDFRLIETLRWTPGEGYFLFERHLERLADSAEYFGFRCDREAVAGALAGRASALAAPSKVRLLLDRTGYIEIEASPLSPAPLEPARVGLARQPIASDDVRLYHKTTRREPYEAARASRPDCDDVILWNERGELTESGVANIILELDGQQVTPPVTCGLLAGTLRAHLLAAGKIAERVLRPDDLSRASRMWLINSVRGRQAVLFVP